MRWRSVRGTRETDPGVFKIFEKEAKCNLVEKERNNASRGMQSSDAVRDQVSYAFMGRTSCLV
jgi:succinate dehydrogenase flavin-adding protein (antitoxin of CptAB toxin-antitoxin module)